MPRPLRQETPGGLYHVTIRGAARQAIFRDDPDRVRFLTALAQVSERSDWICSAFCLMTTHYHLLLRTPRANLARGMQQLNRLYAQGFNRRHRLEGHLFGSRYHSIAVEREAHALEVVRYLALNPVHAGICDLPAEWPWGSYRAALGLQEAPSFFVTRWLLDCFAPDVERARQRLQRFVDEKLHDSATLSSLKSFGV